MTQDTDRPKRCTKTAFCWMLTSRLQEPNARKKGLAPVRMAHSQDLSVPYVVGVAYKTSASDRGVVLNYCPWCGSKDVLRRTEPELGDAA